MTDVQSSPTDAAPTYGSDADGIRQAAADYQKNKPEDGIEAPDLELPPDRVDVDGNSKGVSVKQAAEGLNKYREAQAEKRALFEKAAGLWQEGEDAFIADGDATDPAPVQAPDGKPSDEAIAQRRAELETQELHRQANERIHQLATDHAELTQAFAQHFPELRSLHDMQMLAAANPQRYAQAYQIIQAAEAIRAEHGHVGQLLQADEGIQWQSWSAQQDAEIESKYPELKDPKVQQEAGRLVLKTLEDTGLTKQQIGELWSGKAHFSLRSAKAQEVILDAARYRALKANPPKPVPPSPARVQRPGFGRERVSPVQEEVSRAHREFSRNPTPRNAATLYAAQKRAN